MSDLTERIKASGMRLTNPRKRLTGILEAADRPMSAEEIVDADENGNLDIVTIYRNMAAFCEKGFVQVIQMENGKQLFEIQRNEHDHHHHIICRKCHDVIRLDLCFGSELEKFARERGYTNLTHAFEVYGVCPDCAGTTGESQD